MHDVITVQSERLCADEYIRFLARTDLGSQYPEERFEDRIARLTASVSISLTARNENGLLVGVLFGLTDFAYWLYVTDLGVDRVTLLTNNPAKVHALRDLGIAVDAVAPIIVASNLHNEFYLRTKRERMGHWLPSAPAEQIAKGA